MKQCEVCVPKPSPLRPHLGDLLAVTVGETRVRHGVAVVAVCLGLK